MEKKQPHHSSLLVVKIKDEASSGKYVCLAEMNFQTLIIKFAITAWLARLQDFYYALVVKDC